MNDFECKTSWMGYLALFLIVPIASTLGLLADDCLRNFLEQFSINGFPTYPEHGDVRNLWSTMLGIHAAFGAIAPTLGFSLLSTAIEAAQFPAPAPFIVADAVRWNKYLAFSIVSLAGSGIGYAIAPSVVGLALATAVGLVTVAMTLDRFWRAFELLRDETELDKHVRIYLKTLLRQATTPRAPSQRLQRNIESVKALLADIPPERARDDDD